MQPETCQVIAPTATNSIEQKSHMDSNASDASPRIPHTTQPMSLHTSPSSRIEDHSMVRRESRRTLSIDKPAENISGLTGLGTRHAPVNYSSPSTSTGLRKTPRLGLSTSISENSGDTEVVVADYIHTPTSPIMRRPSLLARPHTAPTPASPHSAPVQRAPFYDQPSPRYKSRLALDVNSNGTIEPDKLPAYAPTVQLLALCRRKREMRTTTEKSKRRNWELVWLLLDGTALRIYMPTSAERSKYEKAWDAKYGRKARSNALKNKDSDSRSRGSGNQRGEESRSRPGSGMRRREGHRSPTGDETDVIDEGDETDDAEELEEMPGSSTVVRVTHPANPGSALGDRGRQSSIQKTPWEPIHSGPSRRPRTAPATYTSPIEIPSPLNPLNTPNTTHSQLTTSGSSHVPSSVLRNPIQRHATPNLSVNLDISAIPQHPALSDIISRKPHKSYAIRHATCARATTYFKRNFVLRFMLEDGKQFLVQLNEWQETLWWLQLMSVATPLALDLDERPMPEPPQYPRTARPTTPGSVEGARTANLPAEYFISSDAPRRSIDNEALY